MFEISDAEQRFHEGAKIRVVGVGGGGCNAVNTMIKDGLSGVEYIVANTDAQALQASLAPTKIQLGIELTKGLGAGANPEVGRKAALDEYEKLSEVLQGADMVFITAGMGGGTGTGAAPVIAKLAKELGCLTVGVVTKPFLFEGKKRMRHADSGITSLEENVDSLITIPNQRLLYLAGESLSLIDTFKKADEVLLNAVRGISELINNTGNINADFADVCTVMANKGLALMGTGFAAGPDRAIKAATEAISSPLLEDISIDGATGIIINITGNESLTMHETNEAVTLISEAADEDAEIIFGTVIDDSMEDNIKITVVATGLGGAIASSQIIKPAARPVAQTQPVTETVQAAPVQTPVMNVQAPVETAQPVQQQPVQQVAPVQQPVQQPVYQQPIQQQAVQQPVAETVQPVRNEEVEVAPVETPTSPLMNSIRQAASQYEAAKSAGTTVEAQPATQTTEQNFQVNSSEINAAPKTMSIAEKLGFINFDEEELDTPSFLRNENTSSAPEQTRNSEI